jgi:endonuclease G
LQYYFSLGKLLKKLLFLILLFLTALSLSAAPTSCGGIYYGNTAPDIINTKLLPKTTEICYKQFAIMHSGLTKTPLWSAEHLTRDMLTKKAKREDDFHEDAHLRLDERAELTDYAHSGYDRGHMSPSGDFDERQSNEECFSLANMVPQDHDNNSGIWADIESSTRYLAKKKGEIYVVTGPLYLGNHPRRIGNRVLVPTNIFKAIYIPSSGEGAAYITENVPGRDYKVISIAELEKISGINIFPQMSQAAKSYATRLPQPKPSNKGRHSYENRQNTNSSDDNSFIGKFKRKMNNYYRGY